MKRAKYINMIIYSELLKKINYLENRINDLETRMNDDQASICTLPLPSQSSSENLIQDFNRCAQTDITTNLSPISFD